MPKHPDRNISYLPPLLLGLGITIRLVVYFQNRSLFLDEANLARNIAERSFSGLFGPLDYEQYAPPLFLVLEKISWLLTGASEWSLRFWPLISACLALFLLYRLLHKLSPCTVPGLLVFWLFAFSQVYIRYATELKQYSGDMAVTLLLTWSALRFSTLDRKSHLYYWMIAGSIAIWASMPAVFVLAGVGAYYLYRHYQQGTGGHLGRLLLLGCTWLMQFGLYYYLILSHDLQKSGLLSYHQNHFWPLWPDEWTEWQRIWSLIQSLLATFIGHTLWASLLGGGGILSGIYFLFHKKKDYLLLLGLPILLCILASGLGWYSLMERLSLFLMPLLGLLFYFGLLGWWKKILPGKRIAIVLLFLPVLPLRRGPVYFFYPLEYEEMYPLLQELHTVAAPDDLIWIDHNARPAFIWYSYFDPRAEGWAQDSMLIYNTWDGLAATELELTTSTSAGLWLVFSHLVSAYNQQEMLQDLGSVQKNLGPPVQELRYPGVAAFKFVRVK